MMDNDDYVPTFDDSQAPLCRVIFPKYGSAEVVHALFATYVAWAHKHRTIGYLIDMRAFNPLTAPPAIRTLFAEQFAIHRELIESTTVAEARVVQSIMTQGVLTAVDWLTKAKFPRKIFTDADKAEQWLRKHVVQELARR